jgi:hypothetical protein
VREDAVLRVDGAALCARPTAAGELAPLAEAAALLRSLASELNDASSAGSACTATASEGRGPRRGDSGRGGVRAGHAADGTAASKPSAQPADFGPTPTPRPLDWAAAAAAAHHQAAFFARSFAHAAPRDLQLACYDGGGAHYRAHRDAAVGPDSSLWAVGGCGGCSWGRNANPAAA